MYTESQRMVSALEDMTATACVELFAAYDVTLIPVERNRWANSGEPLLSSIMGFVGSQLRGACLLASEKGPLDATLPAGGRARDWIGELSNQLIGRLKTKLLGHGIEIGLTTPIVLQGIHLQPVPRAAIEPIVYATPQGMILVWVEAEVAPGFVLPPLGKADAGESGDLLFF